MKEINPDKIKKVEIVVGIPSYNEADTIPNVARIVDKGLQRYFKGKKAVIINADNNSPDNTMESFLNTKTKTAKIYVSTPPGVSGKGNNLRNIFLKTKDLDAKACMIVDSDIKNLTPKWVKCLISPILQGYDYASPVFFREEDDASITNHICFPLVYGLLGYNIRQPIAGEIGFSKSLAKHWLKQKWFPEARKFGIDIFMTLSAIKHGFKFCNVDLGSKIHKPSAPKLDFMFMEVVGAFFKLLSENQNLWNKKMNVQELDLICAVKATGYPDFEVDYRKVAKKSCDEFLKRKRFIKNNMSLEVWEKVEKMFKEKSFDINSDLWSRIVYDAFRAYQRNTKSGKQKIIESLKVLYFARMVSFSKEFSGKNKSQIEKIIQKQARDFYQNRNYLLRK
jgi:hypothetical protein